MSVLLLSFFFVLIISLISLIGVIIFVFKNKNIEKFLFYIISFSAGTLLGGAFFHLIPEALEDNETKGVFILIVIGFSFFYLMERFMRWHHCHKEDCQTHKILGYQNLCGDGIHNFIDGLIIISAFSVSVELGIAISLSVILHEIPQEIGDFGVLLYSGFTMKKALFFNFLSALSALLGVLIGYFLITRTEGLINILLPFAAGGFIYIASADLIPELHREKNIKKSFTAFVLFLTAIAVMITL